MSPPSDHYIPLHPAELIQKLGDEAAVTIFEREQFCRLCDLLQTTIHHEYHARLKQLQSDYAPFDPDDDAARPDALSEEDRAARCRQMFADFDALLVRANYRRLTRDEIEAAVRAPNRTGLRLRLNLDLFEHLEIYVRGQCDLSDTNPKRQRGTPAATATYRRLALIFRLRHRSSLTDPLDTRAITLKLFKDIPQSDLETLLPGASVTISTYEQAQIVLPTLSGIGLTLFKLLKGAVVVTFAGLYGLVGFLALIGGAVGYGIRSFQSYLRTREKHQLSLTRHLYYQNLDNNLGVIYHLLAEAEQQEFREIVLAWWLLWRGGVAGATANQIDAAAEAWLKNRCNLCADFEIADALAKLRRLNLAHEKNGHWRAVAIEQVFHTLDYSRDRAFRYAG